MTFGRGCFVNRQCFFNTSAGISVGDNVHFGPRVSIVTSTHDLGGPGQRAGAAADAPVVIGDGCWIGANVTILAGVSVGEGSVVAAGAVVAADLSPNGLYAGVPARLVRMLDTPESAR